MDARISGDGLAADNELSMRPAIGASFRVPTELRVTEMTTRRALVVGSCLVHSLVSHFKKLGFDGDYVLMNHLRDLPVAPPHPVEDYDFQVVQVAVRNLLPERTYFRLPLSEQAYETLFRETEDRVRLMLEAAMRWNSEHGLMTFVFNFLTPQQNPVGRFMPRCDLRNLVHFFRKLNDSLSDQVEKYKNAFVVDVDEIVSSFGRRYFQDDVLVQINHSSWLGDCDVNDQNRLQPIHRVDQHYPLQTESIMDAVVDEMLAMRRTIEQVDAVKLVVFDLDDTLWRGVLVEEGQFSGHTTEGWPLGLAETILFLKKRGILVALVSKNDEAKITALWQQVWGGRLALEDFATHKINWDSKIQNIDEVMREVNLLPRSVVFIDDNPVERAAVKSAFPDIRVLGSEPYIVRRILLWSPETQVAEITEESSRRTEMVHSQIERESARRRFSKEEFLASLNVRTTLIEIRDLNHPKFPRAFELINKTNQFNTTGRRRSTQELKAAFANGVMLYAFEVEDKFTAYGLVGVAIVAGAHIEQFVMSCRVIGLGVEAHVVGEICRRLRGDGAAEISAEVMETDANFLCRDFLARSGFEERQGIWFLEGDPIEDAPADDIALHKPATQSSVSQWSHFGTVEEEALGANAGVIPDDYGFCTESEVNPWWQVDLQDEYLVEKVIILNRKNCTDRFRNFSLLKSLDGDGMELMYQKADGTVVGGPENRPLEVTLPPGQLARFVRIRLDDENYLHLRSVQVFGRRQPATTADDTYAREGRLMGSRADPSPPIAHLVADARSE